MMSKIVLVSLAALSLWNLFIFVLYGVDKIKAKKHKWRISEATLIIPSFFFASLGAMLGMIVFNHKTSKTKFRITIPLAFLVNLASVVVIIKKLF